MHSALSCVAGPHPRHVGRRLRVIDTPAALDRNPLHPAELFDVAVHVKAAACQGNDSLDIVRALMPWMDIWRDHDLWRSGTWTCRVTLSAHQFTAQRTGLLRFHTDMSKHRVPPAYTVIRCVVPDRDGGGGSMLIHVDDACARLEQADELAVLSTLRRQRPLNVADDPTARAAVIAEHDGHSVARIFDPDAATKGLHLSMQPAELSHLRRFIDLCHDWVDLTVCPTMQAGDVLVFSNHTFLHARGPCTDAGRITDIVLGNAAGPSTERSDHGTHD